MTMTPLTITLRAINFLLMIGIPVFLIINIYKKGRSGFRPVWIGGVAFVLSQVLHIPFNQFLLLPALGRGGISATASGGSQLIILGVVIGLSAGVFEELTRYLVFRYWLNKETEELLSVKYGLGHGGIESVLVGSLALVAFVQALVFSGEGALSGFDPDQIQVIQAQIESYWATPWQVTLLGAWERISAMAFHVGASILVYISVVRKNPAWLMIAVLGHTLLDAFAVIAVQKMDFVLLEAILFIFAVIWLVWAWFVRIKDPQQGEINPEPLPELVVKTPQISSEQIEESRYDR